MSFPGDGETQESFADSELVVAHPSRMGSFVLRLATKEDIGAIQELIPRAARELSQGFYSQQQIESAIRFIFGPDTALIDDGTYYVACESNGLVAERIIGCGGWSRRRTLYGGDQMKRADDSVLDPAKDAARIRAFFVEPAWARRGVGTALLEESIRAAEKAGFSRLELVATLPGETLYAAKGFEVTERSTTILPDGVSVPLVSMGRSIR